MGPSAGRKSAAGAGSTSGPAGHRLLPHTADSLIEAWGPDRATCLTEALRALVDGFAEARDARPTEEVPLAASPGPAEDQLVALLDEVIYRLDVASVVPVRFRLAETPDGAVAGEMAVVPLEEATVVGPAPKAASYHGLSMAGGARGWRCRVLVDV